MTYVKLAAKTKETERWKIFENRARPLSASSVCTSIAHPDPEILITALRSKLLRVPALWWTVCVKLTGRWSGTRPGWCWRESQWWWPACQSSLPQGWQSWSERLTSGGSHWSLHPDGQWCSQWAVWGGREREDKKQQVCYEKKKEKVIHWKEQQYYRCKWK